MKKRTILNIAKIFSYFWLLIPPKFRRFLFTSFLILESRDNNTSQSIKNLIEGLLMVKKELSTALEKNGIKKIDTLNKKFDPNLHQAMMEIENNDLDEGVVVQEIQTGYMMHDRLLRPAMVGVSKKPQKATEVESDKELKPDDEENEKDTKN